MTATGLLGLLSAVFVVGFIVFAFRQGLRVKPEHRVDYGPSVGFGSDHGGGDGGHAAS